MKIVIAPDKFKGSLPAAEVAAAIAAGLRAEWPEAELVTVPVADGGEGTVDAAVAAGLERVPVTVDGPTGEPVHASYARRGEVAVIELADACGLLRLPGGRPAPMTASSFGCGQVLAAALAAGAREIILGVGGSASTDGGAGLLQALGARVLDARGEPLARGGAALRDVAALDLTGLHSALRDVATPDTAGLDPALHDVATPDPAGLDLGPRPGTVILATDVVNPLTGPDGAAEVYGPQKGASPGQITELASGLRRWAAVVAAATGTDQSQAPGAGAAGGVGFAALAVLGAQARPGIELVLDLVDFDAALDGAALVIIGEGSLDTQTLAGKAPAGVARAAARRGIPVVAVAGRSTLTEGQLAAAGISRVYPLSDLEPDPARSSAQASTLLRRVGQALAREVQAVTGP
ncbi:MAG TPA: glycerate kinase [Streptosporangiaceae bacterium]|nr:glycerate kinase [Streptosporangiaceae bacterium]